MSLTDGAAIPAVYADRLRLAEQSRVRRSAVGSVHLHLTDDEIARRLQKWTKPEPKIQKGYLGPQMK